MPRYTLEYRAPRHTKWHALMVSALAPFSPEEQDAYRQQIAEQITALRGEAVFRDQILVRMLEDGQPYIPDTGTRTYSGENLPL